MVYALYMFGCADTYVRCTLYFGNEIAVEHAHHIVLYRCVTPPGFTDFIFELWTSHPGEECYFGRMHVMSMMLCKLPIHVWAVGGEVISYFSKF